MTSPPLRGILLVDNHLAIVTELVTEALFRQRGERDRLEKRADDARFAVYLGAARKRCNELEDLLSLITSVHLGGEDAFLHAADHLDVVGRGRPMEVTKDLDRTRPVRRDDGDAS